MQYFVIRSLWHYKRLVELQSFSKIVSSVKVIKLTENPNQFIVSWKNDEVNKEMVIHLHEIDLYVRGDREHDKPTKSEDTIKNKEMQKKIVGEIFKLRHDPPEFILEEHFLERFDAFRGLLVFLVPLILSIYYNSWDLAIFWIMLTVLSMLEYDHFSGNKIFRLLIFIGYALMAFVITSMGLLVMGVLLTKIILTYLSPVRLYRKLGILILLTTLISQIISLSLNEQFHINNYLSINFLDWLVLVFIGLGLFAYRLTYGVNLRHALLVPYALIFLIPAERELFFTGSCLSAVVVDFMYAKICFIRKNGVYQKTQFRMF